MRHTARGWWLREAGPVAPHRPLAGAVGADVAIVGGGLTGMWTAWHLLERAPGSRVAIVEAGICGEGPSGRNGGFVDHLAHAAARLRVAAGDDAARATIRASVDSVAAVGRFCETQGVDAWFRRGGQVVAAAAPAQDGAEGDAADACAALGLGAELRRIGPDEVAARCASPVLRGGVLAPSTATVHPGRLVRGLRARLAERGALLFEGSPARGIRHVPGAVEVRTPAGALRARAAILATGPRAVVVPPLRRRLTVTSSHMVITEPVPDVLEMLGWTGGEAITDARHLVHYFRTTPDGRIAFGWGGGRIVCGGRLRQRDEVDPWLIRRVLTALLRFFPALEGRAIEHAWGGPIDAAPAHLPVVDTLPGGRVHAAFGYTGNGVGPSQMCGAILAALALDERDDLTRLPIVAPGDRRLPGEPLRVAGGELIRRALDRRERREEAGGRAGPLTSALAALPRLIGVQIGR